MAVASCCPFLSGIVSCDSDTDSNRAMPTACETSKTHAFRRPPDYSSICARLKYDLYDFFRRCFWAFIQEKERMQAQNTPQKSHMDHILGGHGLDE